MQVYVSREYEVLKRVSVSMYARMCLYVLAQAQERAGGSFDRDVALLG
jgi:hypothetical protein